nr:hypothetical protein [Streptomyces sp. 846.5]
MVTPTSSVAAGQLRSATLGSRGVITGCPGAVGGVVSVLGGKGVK